MQGNESRKYFGSALQQSFKLSTKWMQSSELLPLRLPYTTLHTIVLLYTFQYQFHNRFMTFCKEVKYHTVKHHNLYRGENEQNSI